MARIAYPVALVFLFVDLGLLVLDLGDVWRFHHMLRVFKPGSPMSLGVWSLTAFSLPLTLAALFSILPVDAGLEWARRVSIIIGVVPAFMSAAYKGVLLSTSAQPGWKDARWLGAYLTSGAIVLGCAEMIGVAYLADQAPAAEVLRPALAILLIVHALPLALLTLELGPATSRVFTSGQRCWNLSLVVATGLLLPLILLFVGGGYITLLPAALLVIVGGLASRLVLVHLPKVG